MSTKTQILSKLEDCHESLINHQDAMWSRIQLAHAIKALKKTIRDSDLPVINIGDQVQVTSPSAKTKGWIGEVVSGSREAGDWSIIFKNGMQRQYAARNLKIIQKRGWK